MAGAGRLEGMSGRLRQGGAVGIVLVHVERRLLKGLIVGVEGRLVVRFRRIGLGVAFAEDLVLVLGGEDPVEVVHQGRAPPRRARIPRA